MRMVACTVGAIYDRALLLIIRNSAVIDRAYSAILSLGLNPADISVLPFVNNINALRLCISEN
jgi:hypothetical protein